MIFSTERLLLRPLRTEDAEEVAALDADPEVMRYVGGPNGTVASAAAWITGLGSGSETTGFWAVEADGRFLGWLHLRLGEEPAYAHELELGFRLRRDAWGRGFATEASAALLHHAWTILAAPSVFAYTDEANASSRRVMEKVGMVHVETFPDDHDVLLVRYRIASPVALSASPLSGGTSIPSENSL